jgi:periplasmic divalent cation tolerance protein
MSMSEIVVFITAPNEDEAAKIAQALVEQKLAGCVNIVRNIRSIYPWQGNIEDDTEVLMIAKSHKKLFNALGKKVKELHSYSVPEIIAMPIAEGSKDYLQWLNNAISEETPE